WPQAARPPSPSSGTGPPRQVSAAPSPPSRATHRRRCSGCSGPGATSNSLLWQGDPMRDVQRPLTGELKMVCHVYPTVRLEVSVLHLPSFTSSFGNKLLTKFGLTLPAEELLY